MRKKILVTGGAGFIGSHLCRRLLEQGNEVICADNLFTGNRENIIELMKIPYFEFIRHDITIPLFIEVDQIYNLACPASPTHYQFDPIKTTKTSVLGALNMLGIAKRTKARILQASTSEVYGNPEIHPQIEKYWGNVNPIGIRACYDEGKRLAETLFFDYHRQHGVDIRVMRIFNTYGPNMSFDDGRVVSNFIIQALGNKDITVYGDGSQTRSFCFVSDVVSGMIAVMNCEGDDLTGPFNIGNPAEISMRELAERIIALTGSSSQIVYEKLPEDDPEKRKPDISLIQSKVQWEPTVDLTLGLTCAIEYFRRVMGKTPMRPSRVPMGESGTARGAFPDSVFPTSPGKGYSQNKRMKNEMGQNIIRVNVHDECTGFGTKEECHKNGWLHRAFSVFLYQGDRIFIQRRALNKYHSGGLWSNACCSHPREGETLRESVERRLKEELDVECPCREVFSFVYFHKFSDELYEYEYDHVWLGEYSGDILCDPEEAMDSLWVSIDELEADMEENPEKYSVWFLIACPGVIRILRGQTGEKACEK